MNIIIYAFTIYKLLQIQNKGLRYIEKCGLIHVNKIIKVVIMKVLSSLKSARKRDKNCQLVKRKGRIYIINKKNPRFKARQG